MLFRYLHLLALVSVAVAAPTKTASLAVAQTSTDSAAIASAAATALTRSPTSNVKGKAFNRLLTIYLENTAYENAIVDANCNALIEKGVLQTNLYGAGAPSLPNYVAPGSGDIFGVNSDSFILINKNVSTVVDLLDDKGVSWSTYNEGLPYTGFEGFGYSNPIEGNYARKHNLLAHFDSVRFDQNKISRLKNLTFFYHDLQNQKLPQWIFVTPNLDHSGHDTDLQTSCSWTRSFVEPLLENTYFNNETLIYITWQANNEFHQARNHVAGILLGSAVPQKDKGTKDDVFYTHYSDISTVEANWDLHHLGRWDVGANVWKSVGERTGDAPRPWNSRIAGAPLEEYYWNQSYGGVFSSTIYQTNTYVAPNLKLERNGRTILPLVRHIWEDNCRAPTFEFPPGRYCLPDYYQDIIEVPDAVHPPKGFEVDIPLNPPPPIMTPITIYS
ncbi:hypothetical protein DM02DRAFT_689090 [Periconia macrospinosa]|uniref:Phosphoesterase-domain-containing protein n=1 Tax=Periconia macrospinosa TaxID=97972 RepID=A0A2V1DFM0_9PLEO|nr:hypothetical protein DM02DRAFT_689090 [Periconia macrospinosa]